MTTTVSNPTSSAAVLEALQKQIEELQSRVRALEDRNAAVAAALGGTGAVATAGALAAGGGAASAPRAEIPWLVIAAAVAAVVKEPHRIVALELPGMPPLNIWAFEGRRAVFYSHKLRSN